MKDQIQKDFITAMKARDHQKLEALKMIRAAIKQVEIDTRAEVTDEMVEKILRSELKKRNDSIEQYKAANRQDLVDGETYEADLINSYLPELMSREQVEVVVEKVLAGLGDGVQFGIAMGKVMGELNGKADGKLVGEVVKAKLG